MLDPKTHDGDDGLRGRLTDPGFVRGVIRCLKARGHTRITVADSFSGDHKLWKRLVAATGYEAMAHEEGVALVAMSDDGYFDLEGERPGEPLAISGIERTLVPNLLIPRVLAEHLQKGLFLSLPKIKTHRFAVVSLGIKGMQGAVMLSDARPAYQQKKKMHRELESPPKKSVAEQRVAYIGALVSFADRMVEVLALEAPDAVLAEGAPAVGGDGFEKLWPASEYLALGGINTILVDRVGAEYLGLFDSKRLAEELGGYTTSPLISRAAIRFGLDIRSPELRGNGAASIAAHPPVHYLSMDHFAITEDENPPSLAPLLSP